MPTLKPNPAPPSSWLTLIGSELVEAPEGLEKDIQQLRQNMRQVLLGKYEDLEAALEDLLSTVWTLRVQALPFLAQHDLTEAMKQVELEFVLIPQRFPALASATQKLLFGIQLMTDFVEKLIDVNPDFAKNLPQAISMEQVPSWEEIKKQITKQDYQGKTPYTLLRGSLLMELLLFAIDMAADEQLPLEESICYELDYQSAVAVKAYAAAFGIDKTRLPWNAFPKNEMNRLLLEGPVVSEADLEYIHEKRAHLNSWK
jgi:hypothetical protein